MHHLITPNSDPVEGILPDGALTVDKILLSDDFVEIFTTRSRQGKTLLGYLADDTPEGRWYFLAPISEAKLRQLESGALSIRDALTNSWVWQCLYSADEQRTWIVSPEELPEQFMPMRGVPLLPEHDAVLSTRAIGNSVVLGNIPSSVISFVTDGTRSAVKTLLDYLLDAKSTGRPADERRAQYDLPVQRFEFASFEVSFGKPDPNLFPTDVLEEAAKLLQQGLRWATTQMSGPVSDDAAKNAAVLKAVNMLTPPTGSQITQVQISGSSLGFQKVVLGKEAKRKVGEELKKIKKERLFMKKGQVRELDRDNLSFILRDIARTSSTKCRFDNSILDTVIGYFNDESEVDISGTVKPDHFWVTAIAPSESEDSEANPPSVLPAEDQAS